MKKKIIAGVVLLTPVVAFAQDVDSILTEFSNLFDTIVPLIFAVAVIYFLWGLTKFITSAGDAEKHEEGRNIMIWGIIAIFVMASVWGLVRALQSSFDLEDTSSIDVPNLPQ